ncbi:patatin-like phospholipase family protein [Aquincola tertiaricarbonis]|uniref:Patatin-like phospholipase family protein n=1 Tax=Aquincola tertiaricarbonis TaxID=391953 RepID=A0ABY4S4Q6_AQUTE|nr:patatin-like phospholipase family protein [Aquincola tertiaricarbonis]URI06821.1 patatin-like phospholipase family protein [Aquincola tertiaricarbonis]
MKREPESPPLRLVPVLAGGGTRLPAHVGVLTALHRMNVELPRLVGVSGGSIVAALHAAGWSPERLRTLALDIEFSRFKGFSLYQLFFHGGLTSGDTFERWLDDLLGGVCFKDLPLDLAVVATDVRRSEPVVFDREHTPDYRVARAVRHSMGIPLLFAFQPHGDKLLVDGSILSEDALHRDWAGDNTPVCLFRLRGERAPSDDEAPPRRPLFPLPGYILMLIRTFMTTISREFVNARHWPRTVVVDVGRHSPVNFKLTRADKEDLFQRGLGTVMEVLPMKFPELAARLAAQALTGDLAALTPPLAADARAATSAGDVAFNE